jgi:hypothetical protein
MVAVPTSVTKLTNSFKNASPKVQQPPVFPGAVGPNDLRKPYFSGITAPKVRLRVFTAGVPSLLLFAVSE